MRVIGFVAALLLHVIFGAAGQIQPQWLIMDEAGIADGAAAVDPHAGGNANRFPGLTNSLGETFEQATTMAKLIVSGTLDQYPKLTPVIMHGGGALPCVYARRDGRGGGRSNLKRPFQEYLRRFYYDSLVYYPIALRFLIDLV